MTDNDKSCSLSIHDFHALPDPRNVEDAFDACPWVRGAALLQKKLVELTLEKVSPLVNSGFVQARVFFDGGSYDQMPEWKITPFAEPSVDLERSGSLRRPSLHPAEDGGNLVFQERR